MSEQGDRDIAVLGVGMHPWGKWGRNFVEYGVVAARAALDDAGRRVARHPVRRRRRHDAQRLPRLRRRRDVRPGARLEGRAGRVVATPRARRARRRCDAARAQILAGLCDVALVVGADTTPKGFLAPNAGERPRRSGLAAVPAARRDQPDLLRALRPPPDGALRRDRARLRQGEGQERPPRPGQPERALPQGGHATTTCSRRRWSPTRCACSTSARRPTAARRWSCRQHGVRTRARPRPSRCGSRRSRPSRRRFPNTVIEMPNFATDSGARRARCRTLTFRDSIAAAAYEEAGHRSRRRRPGRGLRPVDRARARLVREHRALQAGRGRAAAERRRHHASAAGVPVNPSGGLACFGEAVPAQAIAQVCELTWQLRGQAGDRQVEGARVGLTVNQGLFGHGSSVVLST